MASVIIRNRLDSNNPLYARPGAGLWRATGYAPTPQTTAPGSGLSGTFTHGSTMTLVGSGFGTKTTAAPFRYDDAQTVALNASLSTSTDASWIMPSSNVFDPTASNANLRAGTPFTRNILCRWDDSSGNRACSLQANTTVTKCYIDAWMYWDNSSVSGNIENAKPIRLHSAGAGSPNAGFSALPAPSNDTIVALQYDHSAGSGLNINGNYPTIGFGATFPNTWVHFQWMLDIGSGDSVADGIARMGINHSFLFDHTGVRVSDPGQFNWPEIYFGNYVRLDTWTGQMRIYYECLYIDVGSFARIEIGNASTYAACTHREIQKPSAWSSTQVSFRVNRGSFGAADSVWIFVVDSNNTASAGVAATLGTTY